MLGIHRYYDFIAVRRVANTNEQSDDFIALQKCRKWRGSNAHGFAKGRRAVPSAMVSWSPDPSLLNETHYYEDVFERVGGEVEAEFNSLTVRSPWSLFQPQKVHLSFQIDQDCSVVGRVSLWELKIYSVLELHSFS